MAADHILFLEECWALDKPGYLPLFGFSCAFSPHLKKGEVLEVIEYRVEDSVAIKVTASGIIAYLKHDDEDYTRVGLRLSGEDTVERLSV